MKAAQAKEVAITKPMIGKIFAVSRELDMDQELLHSFVYDLTGCEHISELTKSEGITVIDRMVELRDGKSKSTRGMATTKQLWLIHKLEEELGWKDNPNRLKAFMKRYAHVENEKWLKFGNASVLIEALKKLKDKINGKGDDGSEGRNE